MLNIDKKAEGKSLVYTLTGRLDTMTAPQLEGDVSASLAGVED